MYEIMLFIGCAIAHYLLAGAIYIGTRTKHDSYARSYTINGVVMIIAVFLSAAGKGSLTSPDYGDTAFRVAAAILITALDLIVVRSKKPD